MPPRTLLLRPQCVPIVPFRPPCPATAAFVFRTYSSAPPTVPTGPNQDVLPHVSAEAATTAKTAGGTPPDLEQGTPISEVIKRDPQTMENAPGVLKDATATPGSKCEYSTLMGFGDRTDGLSRPADILPVPVDAVDINPHPVLPEGAKYPLPDLPLPPTSILRKRYPPVVEQVTNLIMRDGKKATAQAVMTEVLAILRTKSAPVSNPRTPIIPTAPPLASLPSDPIAYLQTAIDSVAPLLRIKSVKGSGGFRESVPSPMFLQQRRRKAVTWIIEAAGKKKARMSLAERLADEVVAVVEGRSSAWEKRQQVHKTAVASRANVKVKIL